MVELVYDMPCYKPLTGYRARHVNKKTGKRPIVFSAADGYTDRLITLPCGKCFGCRLEYSRQWAIRCVHEAQLHEKNAFITLTYNQENLPEDKSISKKELSNFYKRLRKNTGAIFKHYSCGEYGDKSGRAHYHGLIFGYDFPDKRLVKYTKSGDPLYRSEILEKAWQNKGHVYIGSVTFESAAYVARYIMKKIKGNPDKNTHPEAYELNKKLKAERYNLVDETTGELFNIEPEFCLQSRGGRKGKGIAYDWVKKYKSDTDKDFITIRGIKMKLPKYYDSILEAKAKYDGLEDEFIERKYKRLKGAMKNAKDNTYDRLISKEIVKRAQINLLKRDLEE